MHVKLRTLDAGETSYLQERKYPLACFTKENILSSFNFFLHNKPYIIPGAISHIYYSLISAMIANIVDEVSPLPCMMTLLLFFLF